MGKPLFRDGKRPTSESIARTEGTGGTETSQYPEEEKTTCDSRSSGERKGKSLNRRRVSVRALRRRGRGAIVGWAASQPPGRDAQQNGMGRPATEGESPECDAQDRG